MAERRAEGAQLLVVGKLSQVEIARHLGVSEAAVSQWKKQLAAHGPQALQPRKATGRPPRLNQQQKQLLVEKLEAGAHTAGFPTEQWTQARVRRVIEQEFGVRYHPNYISRLLHDLGWSVQKPETRALERDEELIHAWLRKDWPRVKKSAAARRRDRV
jgi:transposase